MGVLTNYMGCEKLNQSCVCFYLPQMENLSAIIEDSPISVLLISCGRLISDNDSTLEHTDKTTFPKDNGGNVLVGEILYSDCLILGKNPFNQRKRNEL